MTKTERQYVLEAYQRDRHKYQTQLYGFIKPRLHGEFTLTVYAVRDTSRKGIRITEVNRAWSDKPYFVCKNIWKNIWGTTMVEFDEERNRPQESYGWYRNKWGHNMDWDKSSSWFMQYVRYANLDRLAETKYKYCAYAQYKGDMPLVPYCRLSLKYKDVELLAKNNLSQFVQPKMLARLSADKPFRNYFRSQVREIAEKHIRPQVLIRAYKHGWTIAQAKTEEFIRYNYNQAPAGIDRRELHKYLKKYDIDFYDYLHYCEDVERAEMDILAFGTTFPQDFHAAETAVRERYRQILRRREQILRRREAQRRREEIKEAKLRRKITERLNRLLDEMKVKLAFRVGDFTAIIPATREQFRDEGQTMRNCIGGYYDRHMRGETFCFFIRKDGKPHADVEMSITGKIRQCRLYANGKADTETYNAAEEMAKYFAKRLAA